MAKSKLMKIDEALDLINNDDEIAIGGMSLHRNPMAIAVAIAKSNKNDLTLVDREPGLAFDLLTVSGRVRRIRAAMVTFEHFGIAPGFRRMVESGEVEFIEDVCEGVMAGLRAGAYGLPFMPSAIALDSDLVLLNVKRGIWRVIRDPFNDQDLVVVKAIRPDVALVHVHRADERGDFELYGPKYEDLLKIQAARRVIITAEEVVNEDYFREHPERLALPGFLVTAVVHSPKGAWPTSMYGYYRADYDVIKKYFDSVKAGLSVEKVLEVFAYG
ncbi:CoA transferase subunit A [Vulcanisaeta souniana]|uniref:CoA-transferase n=1 Tax=Vulcanisaeta souniana JCM 11219 TaxID=1293586 RepID=A0A830DZK8_9CREN|nr:CoA transferase subunit A [Vulcanisaeta souniana]BDR91319.1 CoA-transferase [Vulcanisaeta souniana JCM 11219]GGI72284.1 CoA-transferase [Vulcanisaeta souniana JCM 11219]